MTESEFKRWVRKNWKGWLSSYEPRKGGTVGVADLQVVVKKRLVPIELKVGRFVDNLTRETKLVEIAKIRPVQIQWHNSLISEDIDSFFLVGIGEKRKPDAVFICHAGDAIGFPRHTLPIDAGKIIIAEEGFSHYVKKFISPFLN